MATRMDAGMDAGMDALTVRTGNRACPGRAHEQDRTDQRARETGVRNDKCPRKRHCPQDRLARQGRTTRERTTRQENRPEGPAPNSPGGSAPSFEGQQALSPDIFCLAEEDKGMAKGQYKDRAQGCVPCAQQREQRDHAGEPVCQPAQRTGGQGTGRSHATPQKHDKTMNKRRQ